MLRKEEDVLMHYGVLGMRWGHRKDGGPQGYLGTYPKGSSLARGISTGDNSSTYFYQTSGDSLDESVYSMYAEHGISKDMVDVNGGGGDRDVYRDNNCCMCTTAAIMNKMGIKCTAGQTPIGVKEEEITTMFSGDNGVADNGRFAERFYNTTYEDAIHELESRSKPGDFGYFGKYGEMGGHSVYYTIDENGKAFIADFQNPNRKPNKNEDRYNTFSFFNVRDKIPDTSKMEEVGLIRTNDYTDDYEYDSGPSHYQRVWPYLDTPQGRSRTLDKMVTDTDNPLDKRIIEEARSKIVNNPSVWGPHADFERAAEKVAPELKEIEDDDGYDGIRNKSLELRDIYDKVRPDNDDKLHEVLLRDANTPWKEFDEQRMLNRSYSNDRIYNAENTQIGRNIVYDMFDQLKE